MHVTLSYEKFELIFIHRRPLPRSLQYPNTAAVREKRRGGILSLIEQRGSGIVERN
jgi:hypothetical protein